MLFCACYVSQVSQGHLKMSYAVRRKGNRYQVVDTESGKVHSTTTKAKADRQLRLLTSIEKSYTKTGDGEFTRTVKGKKTVVRIK